MNAPRSLLKPLVLAAALAMSGAAAADTYSTLTLPTLNDNLTTWTNGSVYNALFPSSQVLASVPFQFAGTTSSANIFNGVGSTEITAGIYGATHVYTLINTAWGTLGANVGSITFNGSSGGSYTVQLIEGDNVRDHYFGNYVNSTTASYVTQAVWGTNSAGNAHLDMQDFVLPDAFKTQTLTSIVFSSTGSYSGSPFLAAATVAAVPEPETYALLLAGLGLMGAIARRRSPA